MDRTDTLQEALEITRLHETKNTLHFFTTVTTKDFGSTGNYFIICYVGLPFF